MQDDPVVPGAGLIDSSVRFLMAGMNSGICHLYKPLISSTCSQTALFPSNRQCFRFQKLGQSRRLNGVSRAIASRWSRMVFVEEAASEYGSSDASNVGIVEDWSINADGSTSSNAQDSASESMNTQQDAANVNTQESTTESLMSAQGSTGLGGPSLNAPESASLTSSDSTGLGSPDSASLNPPDSASTNLPEASTLPGTQPDSGTTSFQETVPDVISSGDGSGTGTPGAGIPENFLDSASKIISSQKTQALEALTRTTDAVKSSVNELQEKGEDFFNGVKDTVTSSVTNAGDTLKHKYDDLNGSVLKAFEGSSEARPGGTGIDFTSPFRTGTPINDSLKEVVVVVKNTAGTVLVAVGHVVSSAYSSVKGLAPPNVQAVLSTTEEKVQAVAAPLSSGVEQALNFLVRIERAVGLDPENPIIPIFLFFGGSIFVGTLYWQSQYGGYCGDLSAEKVLELIKNDHNIVLVDVRSQELKQRDGVPDIRRRGRVKLSSVEPIKVGRLRSALRNADQVDILLTTTLIRNLKNVKKHTEVVVMDADGSRSRSIARALRKAGIRQTYRLDGGFESWTAAKLKTKNEANESPLAILQEDAEDIADELKPAGIIAVLLGTVAFGYAIYEWEKTLQLIGAFAVFQAIYKRLDSYESVDDLKADIRTLQKPFRLALQGAMQLGGQAKPAKLELATSPSTTAVQDRVLQAAAKHGSTSGDSDQVDETQETE